MITSSLTKNKNRVAVRIPSTKNVKPAKETSQSDLDWWRSKIRRESTTYKTDSDTYIDSYTSRLMEDTISVCSSLSALTMASRKRVVTNKKRKVVTSNLVSLVPDVICLKVTKRRRGFGIFRWRKIWSRGKAVK